MRRLSISQKKLLIKEADTRPGVVLSWDNLSISTIKRLEKLNDYETLWSDADRFLTDYLVARKYHGTKEFDLKGWN